MPVYRSGKKRSGGAGPGAEAGAGDIDLEEWAFARFDLGLSTEEFNDLTPVEVAAVAKRYREALELQLLPVIQFARFMSIWANSHGCQTTQLDFLPEKMKPQPIAAAPQDDGSFRMRQWRSYIESQQQQS